MRARDYARSNRCGAKEYAKSATEDESYLSSKFWDVCGDYYRKDSNGRRYRTEQDEVIEVTTEEELKDRYSSCVNYIDDFMKVSDAKRNLMYQ